MTSLLGFDPLQLVNELVVVVFVVVLLALVWTYRTRVIQALTGDDRIHLTAIDAIWVGIFKCCGTCAGDWTRCFTRHLCCCKSMRGVNLVKWVGQFIGVTTTTVELRNIVVGDLPFDRRADFYLSVECHENPPMMTSVAEEKHPKVVHFPEIITIRLCRSLLEKHVTIRVYELNTFGHHELCNCHINAMQMLDWSEDANLATQRFLMKPCEQGPERETPAWILMEVAQPMEARHLEHFHGHVSTVRTATQDGHCRDMSIADFKHQYTLLDPSGHAIQEPLEQDLQEIQNLSWYMGYVQRFIMFVMFWGLIGYGSFRGYVWSCYRQFKWVTMASMHNMTFPISHGNFDTLITTCDTAYSGTGLTGVPCRPDEFQVMGFCNSTEDGGHFPTEQPRPTAFSASIRHYTGYEITGIPCYYGVCSMRDKLVKYDHLIIPAAICAWILVMLTRMSFNSYIRHRKAALQAEQARSTREMQQGRLAVRNSGWFGTTPPPRGGRGQP